MAQSKREAICEAALTLFAGQGVASTTTRQIAERAGTAEGNIYRHFKSKDELVRYLFEEHARLLHQSLEAAAEGVADPVERLGALVRGVFRFADEHPVGFAFLFTVSTTGAVHDDPDRWPLPMKLFVDTLRKGFASGRLRTVDPILATGWIIAMTQRAIVLHRARRIHLEYESIVDQTVRAVLHMLRSDATNGS